MLPVFLGPAFHDEKRSWLELKRHRIDIFALSMPQTKVTSRSKADRCDAGIFTQFWFVIAMPSHRIVAVSIEIPEN